MRELSSRGEVAFAASVDLHAQQLSEHLRVSQLLAGCRVQSVIEPVGSRYEKSRNARG